MDNEYLSKMTEMCKKLQACKPYTDDHFPFISKNLVDPNRSETIRRYFKENAGLDLEGIAASDLTTWEKVLKICEFVSKHICHDNQKEPLNDINAITLWEYAQRVHTGFNCRWHAILLSELLLSIDIKNHFVTCLPEDNLDQDCHVVNLVWLPEYSKWAMIDSDMEEYVTDQNGIPLSLEEMRAELVSGRKLNIHRDTNQTGLDYMQMYWAKNLYWFSMHLAYAYNLEGKDALYDTYVNLIPPQYNILEDRRYFDGMGITTNATAFWQP
ncbi:transglutaminase domain-containing protein [Pseudobutyrivibrio sp.]|uniref:transglutaminase domain-containing protein n=1 Tax=Pseudobutyrivibrio sp. TaxID=2014367 RepID=UPI0025DF08CB|nr:transglutaminase domain-containing protein [Pseudobutyrivibrio sp.]